MFPEGRMLKPARASFALAVALALPAGCASLVPATGPAPPSAPHAAALESGGDRAGAAREYEALAQASGGPERAALLLDATRDYLAAREPERAARALAALAAPLTAEQSLQRQLLLVELALARGEGQLAWRELSGVEQPSAAADALAYLALRERTALVVSMPVDAVSAEIRAERWLDTPRARQASRARLLEALRDASERGMRIDPSAAPDSTTRGWLELALLAAQAARDPQAAARAIETWRVRYPDHPAQAVVASELQGVPLTAAVPAQPDIALLLPLTGRQSDAAGIVRDGFLTAYFVNPAADRPRVRIYDTGAGSVADIVERAVREGAEFIVGPLTREAVIAAAALTAPHPPMLALNFLPADAAAPRNFYQFALSPENEAREVAKRVIADGHRHGVALVPQGEWGDRVLAAFNEQLTAGGGSLLDTVRFDPQEVNFGPVASQVLGIDASMERSKRLESTLGVHLEFQPRRREDIDFIFEPSTASSARLLRPQLKFYFAGDVAAYATSDAFEPDESANEDVDGLIFPDMPWMLGSGLADSVRIAARDAWPVGGPIRNRLFAFGFDAYRLSVALRSGSATAVAVDGLTGRLTLDAGDRVHRELEWAELTEGAPRPLPASTP